MSDDSSKGNPTPKSIDEIGRSIEKALEPSKKLSAQIDNMTAPLKNSAFTKLSEQLSGQSDGIARAMKEAAQGTSALAEAAKGQFGMSSALKSAMEQFGSNSQLYKNATGATGAIEKAMQGLKRQNSLFESLAAPKSFEIRPMPPEIPHLNLLPNPIHETNDRLEELEDRLKTMTMIMVEGMKIAASLQQAGADNAKTAKRTIWLTAVATAASIVALVMPLVSAKENEKQQAAIIAQVTREFEKLRQSDQVNSQQIAKALEESQKAAVGAVPKQNLNKISPAARN